MNKAMRILVLCLVLIPAFLLYPADVSAVETARPSVLQFTVQDGSQSFDVDRLAVRFSEQMNIPAMIANGTITQAVKIARLDPADSTRVAEVLPLQAGQFSYDSASNTLTWRLNGTSGGTQRLAAGNYEFQLDSTRFSGPSGNLLGSGGQVAWLGLPVFDAAVNLKSGGSDIKVASYSVPSMADINGDGKADLIVGEETNNSGNIIGKVRFYYNSGTASSPLFSGFSYAQSGGADLTIAGGGCLGAFPRVFDWNTDGLNDLIIGTSDGLVKVFLNNGTALAPAFGSGTNIQAGPYGSKTDIDVGIRAAPDLADWNQDGFTDLVAGAYDGYIHVFLNQGPAGIPNLAGQLLVQDGINNLYVASARSSPAIIDLNNDGLQDLVTGNTEGQIYFYQNKGTAASPAFNGSELLKAGGVVIDLAGTPRSRPFVCDFNGDGIPDILSGYADGYVQLYTGRLNPENYASAFIVNPAPPSITATAGTHGTISPSGNVFVNQGGSQSFIITPDTGYHIQQVLVDGSPLSQIPAGGPLTYEFTNIIQDHSIQASFAINTYTLSVNISGSGTVDRSPDHETYEHGTVVHLTAVPENDHRFIGWSGDINEKKLSIDLTMDGNKALNAGFAPEQILYDITLVNGWNYFSLPLIPLNPDLDVVLQSIDGKYAEIWAYDVESKTWSVYIPGETEDFYDALGLPKITFLNAGYGYIIRMQQAGQLTGTGLENYIGNSFQPTYPIYTGWNLIGFKTCDFNYDGLITHLDSLRAGHYLRTLDVNHVNGVVGDEVGYLRCYNGQMGQWEETENNDALTPGAAYWLYWSLDWGAEIAPPITRE